MPRFSTYDYENKIKEQKKRMKFLFDSYNDFQSTVIPTLKLYTKYTHDTKTKMSIKANLEACEIMYKEAKDTLKTKRKKTLSELEEINDTFMELLTNIQRYYKNLSLSKDINDLGLNEEDL